MLQQTGVYYLQVTHMFHHNISHALKSRPQTKPAPLREDQRYWVHTAVYLVLFLMFFTVVGGLLIKYFELNGCMDKRIVANVYPSGDKYYLTFDNSPSGVWSDTPYSVGDSVCVQ
jgi:hypothetical protein